MGGTGRSPHARRAYVRRTRGARNAYVTSTTKLNTITAIVETTTMPMITGRSSWLYDVITCWPRPWRLKIVSVKIAPPRTRPMSIPRMVTTGSIEFRRTWWTSTRCEGVPLARAGGPYVVLVHRLHHVRADESHVQRRVEQHERAPRQEHVVRPLHGAAAVGSRRRT